MYTPAGQPNRDELVQRFTPLVKRVAFHLMGRLPANVLVDDLVQNGMLGLLDALDRLRKGSVPSSKPMRHNASVGRCWMACGPMTGCRGLAPRNATG